MLTSPCPNPALNRLQSFLILCPLSGLCPNVLPTCQVFREGENKHRALC